MVRFPVQAAGRDPGSDAEVLTVSAQPNDELLALEGHVRAMSHVVRDFAEGAGDYPSLLRLVAERLSDMLADVCIVRLLSDDGEWLDFAAMQARRPELLQELHAMCITQRLRLSDDAIVGESIATGRAFLATTYDPSAVAARVAADVLNVTTKLQVHSRLLVALRLSGRSIGMLALLRVHGGAPGFTETDQLIAQTLADHAALAIGKVQAQLAARIAAAAAEEADRTVRALEVGLREQTETQSRAERALADARMQFRILLESAKDAIALADAQGTILEVNPRWEELIGVPRDEAVGQRAADFGPHGLESKPTEEGVRLTAEEGGKTPPTLLRRRDGREVLVEVSRTVLEVDGAPHLLSIIRDVSGRAALESELRAREQQLQFAVEAGGLGFWDFNPETGELTTNGRYAEILGHTILDLPPRLSSWSERIHPDDQPIVQNVLGRHADGDEGPIEVVCRARHGDGHWVDILSRSKVFARSADGRPTRICGTHMDVTSQRDLERTAVEANQRKTSFLATMSHELRTPLSAVLALTEALLDDAYGDLSAQQRRALGTILGSGQHLLGIISDGLDIARIEAGKMAVERREISVDKLVGECLGYVRDAADAKEQTIRVEIAPALSQIWGDPKRLKQVLINLLTNAVKYSPRTASITVGVAPVGADGAVTLYVSDTGPGIAPSDRERIFEPFVRLDTSLSALESGAGLGLAVVRRLVHLHGGTVRAEARSGRGATFIVTLPAALRRSLASQVEQGEHPGGAG